MGILHQELRYAIRALMRSPAFTIAAICTIALAIGANGALFSVTKATLLDPLPYGNAHRAAVI